MIAAYHAKPTTAPAETTTKARTPGRSRSRAGTASIARSAIAGRIPIPIANAPPAQLPYSTIRSFQAVAAVSHSPERWPRNATIPITAPTASVTPPAQSQRVHVARQRRIPPVRHTRARTPKARAARSAASCERTSTASRQAPTARARLARPGRSIARTVSQSASVAAG